MIEGRKPLTELAIARVLEIVEKRLKQRIKEKGPHGLASFHEGLGLLAEEYHELMDAARSNDNGLIRYETEDIAVAAIYILASMDSGTLDW